MYTARSRMSSRQDRLIKHLLSIGVLDYKDGKLIQRQLVPYARRHEGLSWQHSPDLPGCVVIDVPFDPETWEGFPIEVLR